MQECHQANDASKKQPSCKHKQLQFISKLLVLQTEKYAHILKNVSSHSTYKIFCNFSKKKKKKGYDSSICLRCQKQVFLP